jgi:hypothetical protein
MEVLQPIDGRKAGFGVVEGEKLPVHEGPGSPVTFFRNRSGVGSALPQNQPAKVIGNQLLRCGTSVGANYGAACRAKSPADFVAKMTIVEEECDESTGWN